MEFIPGGLLITIAAVVVVALLLVLCCCCLCRQGQKKDQDLERGVAPRPRIPQPGEFARCHRTLELKQFLGVTIVGPIGLKSPKKSTAISSVAWS